MRKRLDYLDAARGLAIFTVVYSHVCLFCVPDYHSTSIIIDFLRTYFLNGFFFISGFLVSHKEINISNFLPGVWKRATQLLIPALVVGLIYASTHSTTPETFFKSDSKLGYWFTISLFEMFITYMAFTLVVSKFLKRENSAIIFFVICLVLYFAYKRLNINHGKENILCLGNTVFYIPFFAFGILTSEFKETVYKKITACRKQIYFLLFVFVCLSYCIAVPLMLQRMLVVVFVIWLLHDMFLHSTSNKIINGVKGFLLMVGNNSLEIYFVHYFLLFPLPIFIGRYLESVSSTGFSLSMAEFMIVGSISVILSIGSVLISKILKNIPFISKLAFGKSLTCKEA